MNNIAQFTWNADLESRYADGECAAFAQAMSQLNGLSVVLLRVRESRDPGLPDGFPRHAALLLADGRLLDATGMTTVRALERRFACALRLDKAPDQNQYPFEQNRRGEEWLEVIEHATAFLSHLERRGFVFTPAPLTL